jgi:phosphoribosylformylglycinamidine synthase subunit PurQ / glutaminase
MKVGIVVFPGSNCDEDTRWVLGDLMGAETHFLWHRDRLQQDYDLIVVPGGFSYGDYLRTGAIASLAPVMRDVKRHVQRGGLVLGICNGFQILCEAGFLPGALMTNKALRFICKDSLLRTESFDTPFTAGLSKPGLLRLPIAHHGGRYVCSEDELNQLEQDGRILFRYCDDQGHATDEANPNGSTANIAGILDAGGRVLGMMPHPERAAHKSLGCDDGMQVFRSIQMALQAVSF